MTRLSVLWTRAELKVWSHPALVRSLFRDDIVHTTVQLGREIIDRRRETSMNPRTTVPG